MATVKHVLATAISEARKHAAKVASTEPAHHSGVSSLALSKDELNDAIALQGDVRLDPPDVVSQKTTNKEVGVEGQIILTWRFDYSLKRE